MADLRDSLDDVMTLDGASSTISASRRPAEALLIWLESQYHLIRFFHKTEDIFPYIVLDRGEANPARARRQLVEVGRNLKLESPGPRSSGTGPSSAVEPCGRRYSRTPKPAVTTLWALPTA